MTKIAETKEMYQLRMRGKTYREIADDFGISCQDAFIRVKGYESKLSGKRGWKYDINKIVYKGIYEHFRDNLDLSVTKFLKLTMGYVPAHKNMADFFIGKCDASLSIKHIKKMCEVTGRTFEELFELREGVKTYE